MTIQKMQAYAVNLSLPTDTVKALALGKYILYVGKVVKSTQGVRSTTRLGQI